jgi:Multicopper oxidase
VPGKKSKCGGSWNKKPAATRQVGPKRNIVQKYFCAAAVNQFTVVYNLRKLAKRSLRFSSVKTNFPLLTTGERYDFVISADQPVGAYWIQLRGLGECGIKRAQQLAILRYARGPYQPATTAPTYDVGIPQGVVSHNEFKSFHPEMSMYKPVKNIRTNSESTKTL